MDYTNLQNLAYNQIVDKGSSMSIVRQTKTSFNNLLGTYASTTTTSYSCYGVRLDYLDSDKKAGTKSDNAFYGMEAIKENTVTFLVAAKELEITPERNDRVLFDSTTYEIISVETLSPSGTNIIYRIKARI